jgi:hypothetical protein
VRVQVSSEAADFVSARGGRLWVWAERPAMCCGGSPAWMHAATAAPDGKTGFARVPDEAIDLPEARALGSRLQLFFRGTGGMSPDVLEIAVEGRRHPKVAAYWDGCLMAMV